MRGWVRYNLPNIASSKNREFSKVINTAKKRLWKRINDLHNSSCSKSSLKL